MEYISYSEAFNRCAEYIERDAHTYISKEHLAGFIELTKEGLENCLYEGGELFPCLEEEFLSGGKTWSEIDALSLQELIVYLYNPEDEDIEYLTWNDGASATENLRRSMVTYITSSVVNSIREHWENEHGVDIANDDIFITAG